MTATAALRITIATSVLALAGTAPVLAMPDFPPPPRSKVQWVSTNMVYNQRAMQVRTFQSRLPPERVIEFYRQTWERGERDLPGYQETDALQPWQIISRIEDGYFLTVQVTGAGTESQGYLAVSKLDELFTDPDSLGAGFPKMQGSEVYNDIVSSDFGKDGRTLLITNSFSVSGNANYYRDWYEGRGWRLDMDTVSSPGRQHVLAFSKGREKVNLVITNTPGGTAIVANTSD